MNRHILYIALMMVFLLETFPHAAFGDVLADEQNSDLSLTITKYHVNDQTLELTFKLTNNSDHDVWICDDVSVYSPANFEVYLSEDEQSLLIRRRLDVPTTLDWFALPYGRYVLLRSGQERTESVSFAVPIALRRVFASELGISDHARRLVLEIGFCNEDLPGLIRDIIEIAEKLNCAHLEFGEYYTDVFMRYFKGIWIAHHLFGGLSQFEEYTYKEGSEEIEIPYTHQYFPSEQILRATIDGVFIPYGGAPAANEPPQSEAEPTGVMMALTGFDVNDTNLELNYQIRNDTEQDIWICKYIDVFGGPGSYEVYTTIDGQTLVMRRRLEALEGCWYVPPQSKYARLRPGENRIESLSFTLPIEYLYEYSGDKSYATHLIVEIGYYPGDLPGMIREILDVAEKMNWQRLYQIQYSHEIVEQYFTGLRIAQWFGGNLPDVDNEIGISWMGETRLGEQTLQFTIDGVRIPYKSP